MPIPGPTSTTTTTLQQWIDTVRYHLDGPRQGVLNVLAAPGHTAGGTSLVFTYALGSITAGSLLSIGEASFYVVDADIPTKTATVIPGFQSSEDADIAAGAVVRVNPAFTDHRIVAALNETLGSITSPSGGLYASVGVDIAYTCGVEGYDLDAPGLIRVLNVTRQRCGTTLAWPRLRSGDWELMRDVDTDVFPSGLAIRILRGDTGYNVRVLYASAYDRLSGGTTLVGTSGIHAEAEDIPPLGAAISLMAGREVVRNSLSSQGNSRRAVEVPQGAVQNSWQGLAARFRQRTAEEAARLRSYHAAQM